MRLRPALRSSEGRRRRQRTAGASLVFAKSATDGLERGGAAGEPLARRAKHVSYLACARGASGGESGSQAHMLV